METQTRLTVRYAETDQMGVVHHAVYAVWFEAARTDFLRQASMSYAVIEKTGFSLPVIELSCRYRYPARYEDEVVVKTRIEKMTGVRVFFAYEAAHAQTGRLLATGCTCHVWTDKTLRPVNLQRKAPELFEKLSTLI